MGTDFLSKIVEQKKEEVRQKKAKWPENNLIKEISRPLDKRSFEKKLQTPGKTGINIIAEIKRASPSKGVFNKELNAALMAKAYQEGGAAALSILTDQPYFMGTQEDLVAARNATNLPVLRKDFLISSYQIYESCKIGADAVLLIVRILAPAQLKDYILLCHELDLDALVEVFSEDEVEVATKAGARLIGINNRDLKSFDTDIDRAMRMRSMLAPDQVAVAASGIKDRNDIEQNKNNHIFNFLIGESLVRAKDPVVHLRDLLGGS